MEGWKLVPIEPTDEMVVVFAEAWYSKRQAYDDPDMLDAYRDMLDAAPVAPQAEAGEIERLKGVEVLSFVMESDLEKLKAERDTLRAQLAERDALLEKAAMHVRPTCHELYVELKQALSATASPAAVSQKSEGV